MVWRSFTIRAASDDAQELAPGAGTRLAHRVEECMGTLERVHRAEKRHGDPIRPRRCTHGGNAGAHGSTPATAIEG